MLSQPPSMPNCQFLRPDDTLTTAYCGATLPRLHQRRHHVLGSIHGIIIDDVTERFCAELLRDSMPRWTQVLVGDNLHPESCDLKFSPSLDVNIPFEI